MKIRLNISKKEFNIFFCSDFHLYHKNVIAFDKRPFLFDKSIGYPDNLKDKSNLDVTSMNETIINNWNDVVGNNDIVFFLGDFCWRGKQAHQEILDKLNGKIYFIMGNHDQYKIIKSLNGLEMVSDYIDLSVIYGEKGTDKVDICLMHYPIFSWNKRRYGSYMLHGHCHGNLIKSNPELYKGKIMDIGCNLTDYKPINFWEVKKIMDSK